MEKITRVQPADWDLLIYFLGANPELITGKFTGLFFNTMIDAVIVDTECRFKALNEYFDRFGFIYDINYLKFLPREDLAKHCNDLVTILREGENSDIDPFEPYEELQILKSTLLENIKLFSKMYLYSTF